MFGDNRTTLHRILLMMEYLMNVSEDEESQGGLEARPGRD
jgi:hypothetical protein